MNKISQFIRAARLSMILFLVAHSVLRAIPVFVAAFVLISVLVSFVELASWMQSLIPFLLWGIPFVYLLISLCEKKYFSVQVLSKQLSLNSAQKNTSFTLREDDLLIAEQFLNEHRNMGVSFEMSDEFIQRTTENIAACSIFWCLPPWKWKRATTVAITSVLVAGILYATLPHFFTFNPHLLMPFSGRKFDSLVRVAPGDAEVVWGKDQLITATVLLPGMEEPELRLKTREGWVRVPAENRTQNEFYFLIQNVTQTLSYRLTWKKQVSRAYQLTPVKALAVDAFSISVTPPHSIDKPVLEQNTPDIRGLAGSAIILKLTANRFLKNAVLVLPHQKKVHNASIEKNEAVFYFVLESEGDYQFELTDQTNQSVTTVSYPLFIQADQPPKISLLSPTEDLFSSLQDKFPLSFEASDDFGVARILLEWEGSHKGQKTLLAFSPTKESVLSGWDWDFRESQFSVGDVIRYRLKAVDGGQSGEGVTSWRVVELTSFVESHEMMEKVLEQWRDQAVELLADITTLESKTKAPAPDLQKITDDFNKAASKSAALEQNLGKIVSLMEKDPYSDYGLWLEHKKMQENLAAMNKDVVKQVQSALQTKNASQAAKGMEQMAAELERMTALSENLTKEQKARDVVEASQHLEDLGQSLQEKMEKAVEAGNSSFDSEIQNMVNEAMKSLQDMAQLMKDSSKELPEDFVNQQGMKDINMKTPADLLSQISDALKKGDRKKALELAKKFMEAAQKMKSQMSKAFDSYQEGQSTDKVSSELDKQQKALDKVVKDQQDLLAQTQVLESKRFQAVLEQQKKLLKELQKRQAQVIAKQQKTLTIKEMLSPGRDIFGALVYPMMVVDDEFKKERLEKSQNLLTGIAVQLTLVEAALSTNTPTAVIDNVRWIKQEEEAIFDALKNEMETNSSFSSEDQKKLAELSLKQAALTGELGPIKKELDALSRKTALLGPGASQPLQKAMGKMNQASGELQSLQSKQAQSSQEQVLSLLGQSQQAMDDAQQSLGKMGKAQSSSGQRGSGMALLRGSGSSPQGNNPLDRVRMPRVQDFKPPKFFREELLESLREKYPKAYEDIIHEYYKKLAQ